MLAYLAVVLPLLAVLWGLHHLWRRRIEAELTEGAGFEYERLRRQDPVLMEGMDEPRFRRVYAGIERPRFPTYFLGALTAFLLGTPLLLAGMELFARLNAPPDYGTAATSLQLGDGRTARMAQRVSTEELQYVLEGWAGFYYFFGLLIFWVLVVAVTMRLYHRRTPGLLREEVLRSR